jgi:hypothetical protein
LKPREVFPNGCYTDETRKLNEKADEEEGGLPRREADGLESSERNQRESAGGREGGRPFLLFR